MMRCRLHDAAIWILAFSFGLAAVADYPPNMRDHGKSALLGLMLPPAALADDDDDAGGDDDDDGPRRRPRPELIVSAPAAADVDRLASLGYTVIAQDSLSTTGTVIARVRPPAGITRTRARAQLAAEIPGASVDLNHVYRPNTFGCGADGCDAFDMVGWSPASGCRPAPAIGMIDTTIDVRHPALRGRSIEIMRTIAPGRKPSSSAHGTAIASLLVGDAGTSTPGIVPGARLVAAEAFHRDARGQDAADAFDLVRALDRLATRAVVAVNMSFSGPGNIVLEQTIKAVAERGIALVAAAGNSGPRAAPLYPGAYAPVIAVTAVDRRSKIYRQAGSGPHVAFAAPGVRLRTAASAPNGMLRSGTSYAVPFVTAAIAIKRHDAPGVPLENTIGQLARSAIDLGPPGRDPTFGWGLLRMPVACTARSDR